MEKRGRKPGTVVAEITDPEIFERERKAVEQFNSLILTMIYEGKGTELIAKRITALAHTRVRNTVIREIKNSLK